MRSSYTLLVCCAAATLLLAGCSGKEYGHVTGVVSVNGEPVEGVAVSFAPEEGGRAAFAETGADGSYELDYTAGVKGAKLGLNVVTLSTYAEPTLDDNNKVTDPGRPERFPPEYNEDPSVSVEVKPGENTFDFNVETSQESYSRKRGD